MGQVGSEFVTFGLSRLGRRSVTRPTPGDLGRPGVIALAPSE